jgi:hypothetical protein
MMCLKVGGMLALAATIALLIVNAKDIKRYIHIESM